MKEYAFTEYGNECLKLILYWCICVYVQYNIGLLYKILYLLMNERKYEKEYNFSLYTKKICETYDVEPIRKKI